MDLHSWLAEWGMAAAPGINVFCLAEMSAQSDLRARLEFHDESYRLLWKLEPHSVLEQHAPCLFQIEPGSAFDQWLGSTLDDFPLSILFTRQGIDDICALLRRFTKFGDSDGRYFLRLGDPASLRLYLDSVAHEPETVAKLFGSRGVEEFYLHAPRIALSRRVQPLFGQGWDHPGREGYLVWGEPVSAPETA
ncbi:DUF4123 domain-containing protein [Salmonella enterica subsp. enterica]|nr:DUF4123 domain-containing protein [Salmonella enterica subsp. enterica]